MRVVFNQTTVLAVNDLLSQDSPGPIGRNLMRVGNTVTVQGFPYKGGTFSGLLLDGKPLEGNVRNVNIIYKKFDGVVKDGALAYADRTRFQKSGSVTPFQRLMREESTPFQQGRVDAHFTDADEAMRQSMLNYDSQYVKLSVDEKFDVNNDNVRRLFDTVFSKEMLTAIGGSDTKVKAIQNLSDNIFRFYAESILGDKISDWESACDGTYEGSDARFQQLVTQRERVKDAVGSLLVSDEAKKMLLDLYQRRYLNYLIDETDTYKIEHPEGIIKSKTNPLYFKRGRLDGDFSRSNSLNVGILRNIDRSPMDLRFSSIPDKKPGIPPELYTRCPDRLNMADPGSMVDRDSDSWLTYNFLSGNTPFVNGLSGSMLIEIRGILYLKEKLHSLESGQDFLQSPEMIEVLNDYFSLISGLYVYVDGGHSLFEIQSSFKQTWVKGAFINGFEGKEWGGIGQQLYGDVDVFKKAYLETKHFDKMMQNQKTVHEELKRTVFAE